MTHTRPRKTTRCIRRDAFVARAWLKTFSSTKVHGGTNEWNTLFAVLRVEKVTKTAYDHSIVKHCFGMAYYALCQNNNCDKRSLMTRPHHHPPTRTGVCSQSSHSRENACNKRSRNLCFWRGSKERSMVIHPGNTKMIYIRLLAILESNRMKAFINPYNLRRRPVVHNRKKCQ